MSEAASGMSVVREGTVFAGRYEVVRCISQGGMGAVYEVVHRDTQRRRALKVMLPSLLLDADMRQRFAREAVVTADIDSEHIVETFDAGIDEPTGCPFLVMELLKGEDLSHRLRREGPLDSGDVLHLLEQVAVALDKTHARSIVHRDLKPENLFVTARDDGTPRIKILDFGIAKVVAHSQAALGTRNLGSPLYMAPEQLDGGLRIGPGTDLYALAQIAFTLLVGRPYWEGEPTVEGGGMYALLLRIAQGATEPASSRAVPYAARLPVGFDAWFAKAIARDPAARFERASEQIAELAAMIQPERRSGARGARGLHATPAPLVADAVTFDDAGSRRGMGNTTGIGSLEIVVPARRGSPRWLMPVGALVVGGVAAVIGVRMASTTSPNETTSASAAPAAEAAREPPSPAPEMQPPAADAMTEVAPQGPAEYVPPSTSARAAASASASIGKKPPRPATGAPTAQPAPGATASAAPKEPWRLR